MLSPDLEIKAIKLSITLEGEKIPNACKVGLNLTLQSRKGSEKCHIIVPTELEVRHSLKHGDDCRHGVDACARRMLLAHF